MKRLLLALSCLMCWGAPAGAQDLVITNARILDGKGGVIERGSIVVRAGKIVSVAPGASSTGNGQEDVNAVLVNKDSTLQSPKDLAGKKVAINSLNNIGDTTIRNAVEKDGGDPSKIQFVELPFPEMPAQLAAGNVDAAWES